MAIIRGQDLTHRINIQGSPSSARASTTTPVLGQIPLQILSGYRKVVGFFCLFVLFKHGKQVNRPSIMLSMLLFSYSQIWSSGTSRLRMVAPGWVNTKGSAFQHRVPPQQTSGMQGTDPQGMLSTSKHPRSHIGLCVPIRNITHTFTTAWG